MTTDTRPRYVVRELTGYGKDGGSRWARETTDFYVLDSWYCYSVVGSFMSQHGVQVEARRDRANVLAWKLNGEHENWLTLVDVTPPTRKDA